MKGGSIESIAIGSRIFAVAADADVSIDKGGKTNELQMNGNGTARIVQTVKGWMIENVTVAIDPNNDDHGYLQKDIANGRNAGPDGFHDVEITEADNTVHSGRGTIVGDIKVSTMNKTAQISLSGPGELSMQ
jgi:hypothetical protein